MFASIFLAARSYKKKSLDKSGAVASVFIGFFVISASFQCALALLAFFFSSSYFTKVGMQRKLKIDSTIQLHGRDAWQVLQNGGVCAILCALMLTVQTPSPLYHFSVLSYFACCNGDTWASELGILSKSNPRLITNAREVPAGTNGGVTFYGLLASLSGGAFVGWICGLGGHFLRELQITDSPAGQLNPRYELPAGYLILLCAAAGFIGSAIDSLLGAHLQYSGFDNEAKKVVSKPGPNVTHICGRNILSNGAVNVLSASLVATTLPYLFFDI